MGLTLSLTNTQHAGIPGSTFAAVTMLDGTASNGTQCMIACANTSRLGGPTNCTKYAKKAGKGATIQKP